MTELILTIILPVITGSIIYLYFKRKLSQIRVFIDALDDALYDDNITEEEFRRIWKSLKELIVNGSR